LCKEKINDFIIIIIFYINLKFIEIKLIIILIKTNGDWGLGIGDWGLGIGDWAQSPLFFPYKRKSFFLLIKIFYIEILKN